MNLAVSFVTKPYSFLSCRHERQKLRIFLKSFTVAMYNSIYLQKLLQRADK